MSALLRHKIEIVRRKHAAVTAAHNGATMVLIALGVFSATMLIDWVFELPIELRAVILTLHVALLGYLLALKVVWPLMKGPDDETVALWIESFYQDASSRLISAVEFSRPQFVLEGASRQMIGAAVEEAEAYIEPKDTADVVAVDRLVRHFIIAMVAFLAFAGVLIAGGRDSWDLLQRALCVPGVEVPRNTRVELLNDRNQIVAKGDSITIEARASGVVPSEGRLRVRYAGGTTGDFYMKPDRDEPDKFVIEIDNVQDSFDYRVLLNDGRSPSARIDAHARPAVKDAQIIQHLPAYTRRPPTERRTNDLQLLAGSRLQLRVQASKPLGDGGPVRNRLKFEGGDVVQELRLDPADPTVVLTGDARDRTIAIPPGTTGLSIHLVDQLGLESKDPAVYRVELVPDTPPRVVVTYPQAREELLTSHAVTTVGFEIADDFGISAARIRFMPAGVDANLPGDGLTARYHAGREFEGEPAVLRVESRPGLALDGPGPVDPSLPKDNFSVRWTGKLNPTESGLFVFTVSSDGGCRIYADEQLVLDGWRAGGGNLASVPVQLEAGKIVDLRIDYQHGSGEPRFRLFWTGPDKQKRDVPMKALFSSDQAIRSAREKLTKSIEIDLRQDNPTAVRGQYRWELAPLNLQPGNSIEWWVEADDANDQTGPGRGESEHHTIRIGTEAQVREAILGAFGAVEQQLEAVKEGQEENQTRLGEVLFAKPGTRGSD